MTDFVKILSTLREQMSAELSRSDVLRALIYPFMITGLIFCFCIYEKYSGVIVALSFIILLIILITYVYSYIYCIINDRDALRSEKYSINKLAIAHGVYGDSGKGIISSNGEMAKVSGKNNVSEGNQKNTVNTERDEKSPIIDMNPATEDKNDR